MLEKLYYNIPEAAKAVGVSKNTIRNWIANGTISAYKTGTSSTCHCLIPTEELIGLKAKFIKKRTIENAER